MDIDMLMTYPIWYDNGHSLQ